MHAPADDAYATVAAGSVGVAVPGSIVRSASQASAHPPPARQPPAPWIQAHASCFHAAMFDMYPSSFTNFLHQLHGAKTYAKIS